MQSKIDLGNRIELSRAALQHNIQQFRSILNSNTLFTAVLKSNAYGHGLIQIAKLCNEIGVDLFAVNSPEEALVLKEDFPNKNILIMGETLHFPNLKYALSNENFWIVVSRIEEIELFSRLSPRPKIHLKTDTGMGRLGTSGETLLELFRKIKQLNLPIDGILTHFASTEDFTEHSFTLQQLEKFLSYVKIAETFTTNKLIKHSASSASTLLFPNAHLDLVRIGISLYGLWPSLQTRLSLSLMGKNFLLKPVLTWKTQIVHTQLIPTGSPIGYGSTFRTNYPTKLGVLPIGYYEGLDRRLSNQGYVLIEGERSPILGRVCMNMCMVDITHIPTAKVGTEVVVIGKSGDEEISAEMHANLTGTINYDVTTRIQKDIPRVIVN
jgi:alanine racemase